MHEFIFFKLKEFFWWMRRKIRREKSLVGTTPIAIKTQAGGNLMGGFSEIIFQREKRKKSAKKGKRNFSRLWGENFSGFLENDASLWSQALFLKGKLFQVWSHKIRILSSSYDFIPFLLWFSVLFCWLT